MNISSDFLLMFLGGFTHVTHWVSWVCDLVSEPWFTT